VAWRGRRFLLIAASLLALVALAAVGARLLLGSHQAPEELTLSTTETPTSAPGLAGTWKVGAGSQVGYRVREKFVNQPVETEAVARTSSVTGSLAVAVDGATVKMSRMMFTVELASLISQDKYASYQVYQRDFFVRTIYLQTDSFPTATFSAAAASFAMPAAGPASVDIEGNLKVHGIMKMVTAHVQAAGTGAQAEVAGSIDVDMRDFAIEPPDISFTRAEPLVTIEFDLKLVHR
jgi:polyisoprenoid-binding protein YceI